jgi:putative acetyltransferase
MRIRAANAADLPAIAAVHRAAFASTAMGYHGEGALVAALHDDGDALVSLVAEAEGRIIGHALFSRMSVEADGADWRAAGLAPVGVLPDVHGSGTGSALIRAGLAALTAAGCQVSFVLGHPAYYPRFGYSAAAAAPFASPYAGPHFMALLLDKALQIPKSGRADYAAAFSR